MQSTPYAVYAVRTRLRSSGSRDSFALLLKRRTLESRYQCLAIISSGSVSRRSLYHSQWLLSSSAHFLLSRVCLAFPGFLLFLVRFSYVCFFVILFYLCSFPWVPLVTRFCPFFGFPGFPGVQKLLACLMSLSKSVFHFDEPSETSSALL